jgi:hypothetical protein
MFCVEIADIGKLQDQGLVEHLDVVYVWILKGLDDQEVT